MNSSQDAQAMTKDTDLILFAARNTVADQLAAQLATLPDADTIDQELEGHLAQARATLEQLRADIRHMMHAYRDWRGDTHAANSMIANLPQLKQLRRAWATYRLVQLLMRDMEAMASMTPPQSTKMSTQQLSLIDPRPAVCDMITTGLQGATMPAIVPAHLHLNSVPPVPANDMPSSPMPMAEMEMDMFSYDELEMKYGPVLAQKLFDEISRQN